VPAPAGGAFPCRAGLVERVSPRTVPGTEAPADAVANTAGKELSMPTTLTESSTVWARCSRVVELLVPFLPANLHGTAANIHTGLTARAAAVGAAQQLNAERVTARLGVVLLVHPGIVSNPAVSALHAASRGDFPGALQHADLAARRDPAVRAQLLQVCLHRPEHVAVAVASLPTGRYCTTHLVRLLTEVETRSAPTWPSWLLEVLPQLVRTAPKLATYRTLTTLSRVTMTGSQEEILARLLHDGTPMSGAVRASQLV
jgi:hypothetical protein